MILLSVPLDQDWSWILNDTIFYIYLSAAYLYGSIPFGYAICKLLYNIDIRKHGSQNIGATNVVRLVGFRIGIVTFFLDASKGAAAAAAGWYLYPESYIAAVIGGLIATFGHTKSVFLKFSGGKGVASFAGFLLLADWRVFLAAALSWLIAFMLVKLSGISAVITLIILPITIYQYYQNDIFWLLLLACLYIISLHFQNIKRLINNDD